MLLQLLYQAIAKFNLLFFFIQKKAIFYLRIIIFLDSLNFTISHSP